MAAPPIEVRARKGQPLGMPPARFLREYWQKRPLLVRGAFPDFAPPLSPDELAGLACVDGALSRIVLREAPTKPSFRGRSRLHHGRNPKSASDYPKRADSESPLRAVQNDDRWELRSGPFDDDAFTKLPGSHWTLLVQDVDKWDADTAALLDNFAFIPSWRIDDVMASYATEGGGVGAHVDQYDVFLLQGMGQRRWSIDTRPNPPTGFREDVELKLLREFRPTHQWILDPGDMLYLPPGVPHDGVAVGECMTFSIGMRAPAAGELLFDFVAHVAESLPESQRFADPDLRATSDAGGIDDAALRRARVAVGAAAAMLDENAFADWFGSYMTRYRVAQVPVPRKRPIDGATLAERLPQAILERDPWSRFAWRRRDRDARLYVAGIAFDAPLAWARALATRERELDGGRLAKLPQLTRGIALLAVLINAGHLRLRRH